MPVDNAVKKVIVHPLVLLSVVDHYGRIGKTGSHRRVVGVLLGSRRAHGVLDVSNSFAVPFDEDDRDSSVWYLDHDYLENMANMFKKVNAKERIVGWYHTGPKLHGNDISVNNLVKKYCPSSVLIIIGAHPKDLGLPTEAYVTMEEVHDDGSPTSVTFEHVPSEIGAEEAEEVGVEHLLRDIKDTAVGSLSQRITAQLMGLKGLLSELNTIQSYLDKVTSGDLPVNHVIIYQLQDSLSLLPNIKLDEFIQSYQLKTNDHMLVIYMSALIRAIVSLHNLINNKLQNKDTERNEAQKNTPASSTGAGGKDSSSKKDSTKSKTSAEKPSDSSMGKSAKK